VTRVWKYVSSVYSMLLEETYSVSVSPIIPNSVIPVNEQTRDAHILEASSNIQTRLPCIRINSAIAFFQNLELTSTNNKDSRLLIQELNLTLSPVKPIPLNRTTN